MSRGTVHVYMADTAGLEDPAVFAAGFRLVPKERQKKIERFLFEKDRVLSLGAGLLLRHCLLEYGIRCQKVVLGRNGKPYLKDHSLEFNLSHSGERVMCAVSDMEVGCDVEQVTDVELETAEYVLGGAEFREFERAGSREERNHCFYRIWTGKESLWKAEGAGLGISDKARRTSLEDAMDGFHLRYYDRKDGYCYAVCGRAEDMDENMQTVNLVGEMSG